MISPLVTWDHTADWNVLSSKFLETNSYERIIDISVSPDETYEFMKDHIVDETAFLPATGFIFLIWETISMIKGQHYSETPVVFEDIRFLRAVPLTKNEPISLKTVIMKGKFSTEFFSEVSGLWNYNF